jgi:hypothetical protein
MRQHTLWRYYPTFDIYQATEYFYQFALSPHLVIQLRVAKGFIRFMHTWEGFYMPRKNQKKDNKVEFQDFYSVHFKIPKRTHSQVVKASLENPADDTDTMIELGLAGWKLSISYSQEREAWIMTHTCVLLDGSHPGAMVSTWHPDLVDVMAIHCYKMRTLFNDSPELLSDRMDDWG